MKTSINVVGVLIAEKPEDVFLYRRIESWAGTDINQANWLVGLYEDMDELPAMMIAGTQLVIAYEVTCANKEESIKKLFAKINTCKKNELTPILIAIGGKKSDLSEEITTQVVERFVVERPASLVNWFRAIVKEEIDVIKERFKAVYKDRELQETTNLRLQTPQYQEEGSNISMMVLSGFIAAAGIVAVAIAFTLLSGAAFGPAGFVVAGIGAAGALAGVGLFAAHKASSLDLDIEDLEGSNAATI
jgi:hypothetical protein